MPLAQDIYPAGFATNISVAGLSDRLCGKARPGHFDGVATIVTKLLLHCTPDIAVFGEKDYQQLLVIKRLATDLDLGPAIIGAPIVREKDGLALSSRNAFLSNEQRARAPELFRVLHETSKKLVEGQKMDVAARKPIEKLHEKGFVIDYFELCDAETLAPLRQLPISPARLLIAATLGTTRLIDNIAVMG